MRQVNMVDLAIAVLAFIVGSGSLTTAVGIWRVRNGGVFTIAFCGSLLAMFLWGLLVFLGIGYEWATNASVSRIGAIFMDADRVILTLVQGIVVFWVLPGAKKK